jgi:hypothetical protein
MTGWGRRRVPAPGRSATRGDRQLMFATAAGNTRVG